MAGKRGFAAMEETKRRTIASEGGRASHQKGTAHEFTHEEAVQAGRKGGKAVSQNREHMAAIGRKGGRAAHRNGNGSPASEAHHNGNGSPAPEGHHNGAATQPLHIGDGAQGEPQGRAADAQTLDGAAGVLKDGEEHRKSADQPGEAVLPQDGRAIGQSGGDGEAR